MANENTPNSNKSQFFVTLGACEWLNRKHTIFGKVTGDTIYNLLRMGESDIGDNDRPVEPIQLLGVEVHIYVYISIYVYMYTYIHIYIYICANRYVYVYVNVDVYIRKFIFTNDYMYILYTTYQVLWNPFDDIVPRNIKKEVVVIPISSRDEAKKKRKGTKDLKLLSFGDEEGEGKGGEAIDVIQKKKRNVDDVKVKSDKVPSSNKRSSKIDTVDNNEDDDEVLIKKTHKIQELKASQKFIFEDQEDDDVIEELEDNSAEAIQKKLIKEKGLEFQKLKEGLLRSQRAVKVITGTDAAQVRYACVYVLI
jgi:cyclophilin family peptidyl-prolyl cis-trans isomerase